GGAAGLCRSGCRCRRNLIGTRGLRIGNCNPQGAVSALTHREEEHDMTQPEKQRHASAPGTVVYTAKTHTTGGRESGVSRSSDGRLDVKLSLPGSARIGTNPEQLFAAGWSACFESAIGLAARKRKIGLPADLAIDAEVDLHLADGGYYPRPPPHVSPPG